MHIAPPSLTFLAAQHAELEVPSLIAAARLGQPGIVSRTRRGRQ